MELECDRTERDRHGRRLRYVFAGGAHVNAALVREGFPWSVAYPPDFDCKGIPYKRFPVNKPYPHPFDSDNDGIGCESLGEPCPPLPYTATAGERAMATKVCKVAGEERDLEPGFYTTQTG